MVEHQQNIFEELLTFWWFTQMISAVAVVEDPKKIADLTLGGEQFQPSVLCTTTSCIGVKSGFSIAVGWVAVELFLLIIEEWGS